MREHRSCDVDLAAEDRSTEHKALAEFYERVDLVVYLVVVAIATQPVARMLGEAWYSYGVGASLFFLVRDTINATHQEIVLFVLGAYAALVVLLVVDSMKRIQGVLLAIASAIALWELRSQGLFTPLYLAANGHALVSGFAAAFVVGGGLKMHRSEPPFEFRRASTLLFWSVSGVVSLGFVENHLIYANPLDFAVARGSETAVAGLSLLGEGLFTDLVASSAFVAGAFMFVSYESKTDLFGVGVQRAMKTYLAAALAESGKAQSKDTALNMTKPLSDLVTSMETARYGWGDDEYVGPTELGEYHLLGFQTRAGELFPSYVNVDILDYAGEYVDENLVSVLESTLPRSRLSLTWLVVAYEKLRGLPALPEAAAVDSTEVQRVMAKKIVHADTLMVLVDAGSLVSDVAYGESDYEAQQDLSTYISTYSQILRQLEESVLGEKEVVLVVSKADYLYPLYRDSNTTLPFFEWVNYYLLETAAGREKLGPLLNQAQVDRVYPVYYVMDHEESLQKGEPVPKRPLEIRGNDELLDRITEGESS